VVPYKGIKEPLAMPMPVRADRDAFLFGGDIIKILWNTLILQLQLAIQVHGRSAM
jgi:hypothetical protein